MRITNRMMAENAIRHMNENTSRIGELQEQIASGKRYETFSDNPSLAAAGMSLRTSLRAGEAYLETAAVVNEWISVTENSLGQMVDIAGEATNLALGGLSDTEGASERHVRGVELDTLIKQAIDIGNTSLRGQYIFSGFSTNTQPFSLVNGSPDSISYAGDTGTMQRAVGPGQLIAVNFDSDATFSPFFSALVEVRDALLANDTAVLQSGLNSLDAAFDGINDERTANGARLRQVENATERLSRTQTEIQALLSAKEDVNMAEAITVLRTQESSYQAVLEVGRRAIAMSNLFESLR
ncbi:MAG: flagellar hook-associated protein 3 [Chloroflexi bacterium]|nr:MAG: flagellar hook-associated protein 3 [Chloroflexota bacterium]MBL1194829.1 flagellar hook-associated protein 3 [Chloroflexota bacterium]NOH12120.1 flagellar hook-associated protein FlgL [Chloroflexota bacterium]